MEILIFSLSSRRFLLLRSTWLLLLLLIIQFQCACSSSGSSSNLNSPNAYKTLGVPSDCASDDIRQRYRKLCLEYHPDKNVHKLEKERKSCEDRFKQIQQSYSQIGNPSARKEYDRSLLLASKFGSAGTSSSGTFPSQTMYSGNDPFSVDNILRSMMTGNHPFGMGQTRQRKQFSFNVNGVDISHLFNPGPTETFFQSSKAPNDNLHQVLRPTFVQHVSVSLEDLYTGADRVEFVYKKKSGILPQCKAVVRGGLLRSMFLQSCVVAFPMFIRSPRSWRSPLVLFILTLYMQLPQKQPVCNTSYVSSIESGWKAGTKLTFRERDYSVVFVLNEENHRSYHREGNNLHATVKITSRQAKNGCTITLPSLCSKEEPIALSVAPKIKNKEVLTIPNRGWPIRKNNQQKGNMIVLVEIIKRKRKKRRRKE